MTLALKNSRNRISLMERSKTIFQRVGPCLEAAKSIADLGFYNKYC